MSRDVGGQILSTFVVFGAIILVIVIAASFFVDLDDCHDRGGVIVNTFLGYDCVSPLGAPARKNSRMPRGSP